MSGTLSEQDLASPGIQALPYPGAAVLSHVAPAPDTMLWSPGRGVEYSRHGLRGSEAFGAPVTCHEPCTSPVRVSWSLAWLGIWWGHWFKPGSVLWWGPLEGSVPPHSPCLPSPCPPAGSGLGGIWVVQAQTVPRGEASPPQCQAELTWPVMGGPGPAVGQGQDPALSLGCLAEGHGAAAGCSMASPCGLTGTSCWGEQRGSWAPLL